MVTPLPLIEGTLLPNAVAAQYTSPAKIATVIKKLTVTSVDAVAGHAVTIYLVPSGGAPTTANMLINARPIGTNETLDITEAINKILAGGDSIQAFADVANLVNIGASGVQIA